MTAQPARKPADRRPADLAAIHIAQKALGLTRDDAESLKLAITGKSSAADMTLSQRRQYLAHLSGLKARLEGLSLPTDHPPAPRRMRDVSADDPGGARRDKARALWHALAVAGHVRIDSDFALMAYVERQTKMSAWRFLNGHQINLVIESLKTWCRRVGVEPT